MKILTEDNLQAKCVQWANNEYKELRHFGIVHIPNGGTRDKIEAGKLKAMGTRAGFPDLMVILPNGHIFFIEMKDSKGKQSDKQKECEAWMKQRGLEYYVINNYEDFKSLINYKMQIK